MDMSALSFFDGVEGSDRFTRSVEEESELKVSVGSHSCHAALQAYDGVKRLAILLP